MSQTPSPTSAKVQSGRWAGISFGAFRPNHLLAPKYIAVVWALYAIVIAFKWFHAPADIPSPSETLHSLVRVFTEDGGLGELVSSLTLNLEALGICLAIGLSLSYISAVPVFKPLSTLTGITRFLAMAGLPYFFRLYIGGGHSLKLAILTFGLTVFFVKSGVTVVNGVPRSRLEYVRTMRAGHWRVMYEQQILGTARQMVDIFQDVAAMGWIMLTTVDTLVRSEGGLGAMLSDTSKHSDHTGVIAIQLIFLTLGSLQDFGIRWIRDQFPETGGK
jgi:NitT/TauT family transport system permease protein